MYKAKGMARVEKKTICPNVKEIKQYNERGDLIYHIYQVSFQNRYIAVKNNFKTLEDAQQFRTICLAQKSKLAFEKHAKCELDYSEYPDNLMKTLGITEDNYDNFYEIASNFDSNFYKLANDILTPRELETITLHYKNFKTLEEIGKIIGVTRERARQIESKGIKKIQYNHRFKELVICEKQMELISQEEHDRLVEEERAKIDLQIALETIKTAYGLKNCIDDLKTMLEWAKKRENSEKITESEIESDCKLNGDSIDVLNLSVRSNNCLKRRGVLTINDLKKQTIEDLMKMRNLGKKSMMEIRRKMLEYCNFEFEYENNDESLLELDEECDNQLPDFDEEYL